MSTSTHPTETLERASKPAARWRNRWWIDRRYYASWGVVGPGEYPGRGLHPSKDVAETKAIKDLNDTTPALQSRGIVVKYLGAEPVPEAA